LDEGEAKGPARAETVHELPLFRGHSQNGGVSYPPQASTSGKSGATANSLTAFVAKKSFAFAGIWEFARLNGKDIFSAAMIVGEPNALVGGVHDRMRVMLLPKITMRGSPRRLSPKICEAFCGTTMKA
jgi:hypothetical protein